MRPGPEVSLAQALAGAAAAALIAALARRLGTLTTTGMIAAIAVGTCAATAGWRWAALLVFFFVASTALSPLGGTAKRERTEGRISKPGARDATQVLANGGLFAAGALLTAVAPSPLVAAAAIGALAGAASDTWATEVGVLSAGTPRLITSFGTVPAGTSGGVTIAGTAAGCAGAGAIAGAAKVLQVGDGIVLAVVAGGIAGMLIDSALGATVQAQRWCGRCNEPTERVVHPCGTRTTHRRGWRWLDNDGVNALATVAAAAVAASIAVRNAP